VNLAQADFIMRKMDGIWALRGEHTDEERNEWLDFLMTLDHRATAEACDALRLQLKWRPSMAELRSSYRDVLAVDDELPKQLAGEVDKDAPSLRDRYGSEQGEWVYCWRCDMAISLDERYSGVVHTERLGLSHRRCPMSGAAPRIPEQERSDREDYRVKHHIRRPS
jgi:hypothetical protein